MAIARVIAVVPAFNEASSIAKVIQSISEYLPVIVVNDGSTDQTPEIARMQGAIVVNHDRNKGYELALSSGINKAKVLLYTHAITIDADGQHDPRILSDFLEVINRGADLVVGRRDRLQRISERVFSLVATWAWGVHDPLCGMKAYNLDLLEEYGPFDTGSSVGTEFTLRLIRNGISFEELPVKTFPRLDKPRFGGVIKANVRIFRALFNALTKH